MKTFLSAGKIIAEPSSSIGIGAALQGILLCKNEKVCFLISKGNVRFEALDKKASTPI